jgi:tetratricopeptide (TPR) repeat protein
MSKAKRKAAAPTAPSRDAALSTESDPFAGLLRILVSGLVVVRWLIPAESAASGDTLWVVQLDLAIVVLWAWAGLRSGRFVVRWSLFDSALWALVAAHGLSAAAVFVTGGDRRAALNMAWEWVGLGITFFLVRQTIQNALDARRLAAILVAIAVVLGGLGIWQHYVFYRLATREYTEMLNEIDSLEKNPGANARRLGELQLKLESQGIPTDEMGRKQYINRLQFSNEALGPFALANTFAGYLLVMLLLAAELFRTLAGPRAKSAIAAWAAAFLVLVYCLILTKSRTAWVGLFIAGAVWGITLLVRNRQRLSRRLVLGMGLGLVGIGVLFGIAAVGKGFDAEVVSEAPKSLAYRFQYWNGAAHTIAAAPQTVILGTGPGNFRQHYLRYKVRESSEEIADPHNWLLDLWASGGILAVAAFLACLVLAVVPVHRRRLASEPADAAAERLPPWTSDLPGPALGFLLALIAPVAGANGNFDFSQLALFAIWIVVFGVLRRGLGTARLAPIALGAAALGLMIHLSGAGGIEMPGMMQLLLVLAALAFATVDRPTDATVSLRLVIGIAGVGVVLFVALFLTGTLPVLNRRAAIAQGEQALFLDGKFDEAQEDFIRAAFDDPLSPEPHTKLADALFARWQSSPPGLTGDNFAKACEALKEAMHQDPLNPSHYRRLGEFYLARFSRTHDPADAQAAADAYQRAIERYPNDVALRSADAQALADAGKIADAKQQAKQALELDEINHRWGHTDRYLPDTTLARLKALAGK